MMIEIHDEKVIGNYYKANNSKILIIIPGSKEWLKRYDEFSNYLLENNYDVFVMNIEGHDRRISEQRYITTGKETLISEVNDVVNYFISYKGINIFGHSLGSMILRNYLHVYQPENINKVILSGTTHPVNMVSCKFGVILIKLLSKLKGSDYCSPFIEKLVFGNFLKKTYKKTNVNSWLAFDERVTKEFNEGEYSNYNFTLSYYQATVELNIDLASYQKKLDYNALLITGKYDPVSNFTKYLPPVENTLQNYLRIDYQNSMHEILYDREKSKVFNDIILFLKNA